MGYAMWGTPRFHATRFTVETESLSDTLFIPKCFGAIAIRYCGNMVLKGIRSNLSSGH